MNLKKYFMMSAFVAGGFFLSACDVPPAVFSAQCIDATVSGEFVVGQTLNAENTLTIQINVEEAGIFEMASVQNNGYFFSASGRLMETGLQSIVLTGHGSPDLSGSDTVVLSDQVVSPTQCSVVLEVSAPLSSEKIIISSGQEESNFNYYVYALNENGALLWKKPGISEVPAISNGRAYLNMGDTLRAVDLVSGADIWSIAAENVTAYRFSGSVTIDHEVLYVSGDKGDLLAISASDGSVLWTFQSDYAYSLDVSAPVVVNDRIFYASQDGSVYALDLTGTLKWKTHIGASGIRSSLAVSPTGIIYVGSDDGNLRALAIDPETLDLRGILWTYNAGISGQQSPALAQDKVVIQGAEGNLTCLDQLTGAVIWERPSSYEWTSPLIVGDRVYALSIDYYRMTALDLNTGNTLWNTSQNFGSNASVTHHNGTVYYAGSGGVGLYARDAITGALVWNYGHYTVSPWNIYEGISFMKSPVVATLDGSSVGYPTESGNRQ